MGITYRSIEEMIQATKQTLDNLGYKYSNPDKDIHWRSDEKTLIFDLYSPKMKISINSYSNRCSSFPYCPSGIACIFLRPWPSIWIEPVSPETRPHIQRILKDWVNAFSKPIWKLEEGRLKELFVWVRGPKAGTEGMEAMVKRKWEEWGVI
jgi:hypothetical protein